MENYAIILLMALVFSAFFSGIAIAFLSSNKLLLEIDRNKGLNSFKIISLLGRNLSQISATFLIGSKLALIAFVYFLMIESEPLIIQYITDLGFGITIIQIIFSTILIMFSAEFIPKALFKINPNKVLNLTSVPVYIFYVFLYPLASIIRGFSVALSIILFKRKLSGTKDKSLFAPADHNNLADYGKNAEEVNNDLENDFRLFQNALDFSEVKIRECTIPRNEIAAI